MKLRNNKIKDPSILNRINFNELEILDLSLNEITSLKFVLDMKAKNLKYLILEHNYLNSIYPLLNANFLNLKLLVLNNNNFNYYNLQQSPEYIELKKETAIQLESPEDLSEKTLNSQNELQNKLSKLLKEEE